MSENYSPLRYPGGKARLAPFLASLLGDNDSIGSVYVEPYAGGAGAALRLLLEEYVEEIVVNDADQRIGAFWESVTRHTEEFLDRLDRVDVTVAEWRRQRETYESKSPRDVFSVGFSVFYLNRTTRSGIVHNGGPIGGYDQSGTYKIDARFNRLELSRRIQRIGAYSDRISVSCLDGLSVVRSLARGCGARRYFVYLDPPYYSKGDELYMNRFRDADHQALAAYLCRPKKLLWVMTYDNVPAIQKLYRKLPSVSFSLSYSAYQRREGHEILIHPKAIEVSGRTRSYLSLW